MSELPDDWKNVYPYTLDKHLKAAMLEAFAHGDLQVAKKIQDAFLCYRRSDYGIKKQGMPGNASRN